MESFTQMTNSLISSIDKSATNELSVPTSLKNTLKTLVSIKPNYVYPINDIYNKTYNFKIPRNYNELSQLYIKCYLSTSNTVATLTPNPTFFATKVFKRITLKTTSGTTLQTITPAYTYSRACSLYGSANWSFIEAGMQPSDSTFAASEITCVVPLFLFFSDHVNSFLQTRMLEPLELEIITNDDFTSMGMNVTLTSARYEVYACFHDTNTSNAILDKSYTVKQGLFRTLKNSYNIFEEDKLTLLTGSTTAKLLLRCPHPTFAMHIELRSANSSIQPINTITLNIRGNQFLILDKSLNYEFSSNTEGLYDSANSIWFSKLKSRVTQSGLVIFSGNMFPTYLNIIFNAIPSDCVMSVVMEHITNYSVSDIGTVQFSDDASLLDQNNSSNVGFLQR